MTKDKRSTIRGGFYWKDDRPSIRVTNVLKVLNKPAITYWFGKEVYYALAKDPSLGEKEALAAPYKTSGDAKGRGTTVHSIVEAWKQTKKHIETIPVKYKGYAEAFYKWIEDYKMVIQEHEKTVFHKEHRYAGTLDILAKNNSDLWVLDVKTGKDIYLESHLQVSAYQAVINDEMKIETRGGVILLGEDGKYKFAETEYCFEQFLAVKLIWEWQNKKMLEKVGYYETEKQLEM